MDLAAYLARIGFEGPREASVATLRRLHKAHLGAIPFENLDILLGRPIRLELEALERKLVAERRGGYCFEQNTLFRAALEELGFEVTSLAARVRLGTRAIRPRTHMLLRVRIGDASYVADVGFGGDGPRRSLELAHGASEGRHELVEREGLWVLRGGGVDLYAFTLEPHYPVDFEMANHFTSTHPESHFVQSLTAQRVMSDRRAVLRNRDLVIVDGTGGETTLRVQSPDDLLDVLREHFDLAFPAGTRFAKPDF